MAQILSLWGVDDSKREVAQFLGLGSKGIRRYLYPSRAG